jgi:hypothetical protein
MMNGSYQKSFAIVYHHFKLGKPYHIALLFLFLNVYHHFILKETTHIYIALSNEYKNNPFHLLGMGKMTHLNFYFYFEMYIIILNIHIHIK